jgi:hypothetical protein
MDSDTELDYEIDQRFLAEEEEEEEARTRSLGYNLADADQEEDDASNHERLLRATEEDEEKRAEELYNDPKNGFGMQKSWKMVSLKKVEILKENDGMPFFFLSKADGPMLSVMATKQILVLLHMIHSPILAEHVIETEDMKPTINADGYLEKLVEKLEVGDNPYKFVGDYDEALARKIDDMKDNEVYDFRGCGGAHATVNRVVSVGEILVCPVTATYTKNVSPKPCT